MNWKKVKLGNYIKAKTGKLDANAQIDNGKFPFFTCSKDPLQIDSFSYDCECVLVAGNGDLNVKYYDGKFDAYQRTYIIESIDKQVLDVRYLYQFMLKYVEKLRFDSIGGVIKYIKIGNITDVQIPLPDLKTQQHIAQVLDKADALRQQNRQLLAHYDELLQSTFIELFGDPVKNPKGWELKKLGEVVERIIGGGTPSREKDEYFTGDICWATSKDIKNRYLSDTQEHITEDAISKSATKLVDVGTILIVVKSKILMHTLPITITKVPVCFGQDLKGIIPKPEFNTLFAVNQIKINEKQLLLLARGVNTEGLTLPHLNNFSIILPPLPLQAHFAKIVEQIEFQKAMVKQSLLESEALFEGLLAAYFG